MELSARMLKGRDYSTLQKGGASIQRRRLTPMGSLLAYAWIGFVLLLVLSPHIGVLLLSFSKIWSFSPLPDGYTLAHYAEVFHDSGTMIRNTLLYCGLSAGLDVVIGVAIAYLMLRTTLPARRWRCRGWCWPSATCGCTRASCCPAPTCCSPAPG
jgi:iron(III) transport system permease protein